MLPTIEPGIKICAQMSPEPTEDDLKAWQLWVKTVFLPITSRMYELVVSKSDLLIEREMPNCLLHLCAHVTGYQPIIRKWEAGDFSRHTSYVSYPGDLLEYAAQSFQALKAEQEKLLGQSLNKRKAG